MIYALYLFLMVVIYNYIDFCYIRHKLKFGNNDIKPDHKNPLRFIVYIFIVWSFMVSYMVSFSYKGAVIDGYPKTSIVLLIGVVLIWGMPIYVKLFSMYKKMVVDFN